MIHARGLLPATLACVALGFAAPRAAVAADETSEPQPPIVVAIDFDSLPVGTLPPLPGDDDGPRAASEQALAVVVKVHRVNLPVGKRKKTQHGAMAKKHDTEFFDLSPARPEIAAMYVPSVDGTEFEGEAVSRMVGRRGEDPSPVRWETLNIGPEGRATLEIKDLWFYAARRSVTKGSTAQVVLKAVAWEGGKPWLFAMRDDRAVVTFVMPRTSDVSAEAMVGSPVSVRGGFTRVSLPIGRWGSSSLVAHLPSLELKPPMAPSKPGEAKTDDAPVEVTVELVQTMSERSPTVLVRRSRPDNDRPAGVTKDD